MRSRDGHRAQRDKRDLRVPLIFAAACGGVGLTAGLIASWRLPTLADVPSLAAVGLGGSAFVFLSYLAIDKTDFGGPVAAAVGVAILQLFLLASGAQPDLIDVGFFIVIAIGFILMTGFWRLWAVGSSRPHERTSVLVASGLAAMAGLTMVFGFTTTYLYSHDHLQVECPPKRECPVAKPLVWHMEEDYLWHFADTIPVLKVPASANWDEPVKLDGTVSGVLLLIYKLLVVVPVIGILTDIFKKNEEDDADDAKGASPQVVSATGDAA